MTLPKGKGREPVRGPPFVIPQRPAKPWSRSARTGSDGVGFACKNPNVSNPDRLSGLDTSFLELERDEAHMHFPLVPLAKNTAIGIAVMSYNGKMGFGINEDYDAIPDPESLADSLRDAVDALVWAAKSARPAGVNDPGKGTPELGKARRASRSGRLRVVKSG
jgi:hypothetical protein